MAPLVPAAAALLAAAVSAADCVFTDSRVDLSCQLPDPPERSQGKVGNCHAFASVGAIEAGLFRQYGRHVALSEADLFVRSHVGTQDYFSPANGDVLTLEDTVGGPPLARGLQKRRIAASVSSQLRRPTGAWLEEGSNAWTQIYRALRTGLALRATVPYFEFHDRYLGLRGAPEDAPVSRLNAHAGEGVRRALALADLRDGPLSLPTAPVDPVPGSETPIQPVYQRLLSGGDEALSSRINAERLQTHLLFQKLGMEVNAWDSEARPGTDDCANLSPQRVEWIEDQLRAGRPLAISLDVSASKDWGTEDVDERAGHAVLLTGYEGSGAARVYKVRNSWGGWNPDLPVGELCRVALAVAVTAHDDEAWRSAR